MVVVCGTVLGLGALTAVVILTLAGQDSEVIFRLISLGVSTLGLLFGVGGLLYAGNAARAARATEDAIANGAIADAVRGAVSDTPRGPAGTRNQGPLH